jgi:hypothetical protein
MSFDAALFREMPPSQYGEMMTDPYTGLVIPKTIAANLAWRKKLVTQAKTSTTIRRSLKAASAASPIFWINAFAWTFLQKKVQVDGHETKISGPESNVPFITWKVQDDAVVQLTESIDNGYDAVIHKARDMGASWLVLAVFQWYFQFRPNTTFLELSRKERLVDRPGDMDSLFEKHRYLMRWQPEWLRPQNLVDNKLHLENKDIGTTIEGESTNADAGQASRKTAILLDEFARVKEGEEIDLATADTSACRIFNSTPGGPNTHFTRIYRQMKLKVREGKIISLPWWMHPDKGREARVEKIEGIDEPVSLWWFEQAKRRSKRNMAQNVKGEHGKAGDMFFDEDEIEKHRQAHQRDPLFAGDIKLLDDDLTFDDKAALIRKWEYKSLRFVERGAHNPWRFWVPLVDGRPNQNTRYVFGVDISNGSGASNSVISVLDNNTNMIVAKFWDAFTSPEDLAEIVALAGVFFGGKRQPLIIFEKNGPGISFGRKLLKLKYPTIYYQEVVDQKTRGKTSKWGWHSSDTKKEILLGEYRDALKVGTIINPCKESLDEALEYAYETKDGGKGYSIEAGHTGEEDGGGSALHGDHVIADALTNFGRKDLPPVERDEPSAVPRGTPAFRRELRKQRDKDNQAWSR